MAHRARGARRTAVTGKLGRGSATVDFTTPLWRHPGKGGWTFATVPSALAPTWTRAWGRTPLVATIDRHTWTTSVWRNKHGQVDLPVPREICGTRRPSDAVHVRLTYAREDD